MTVEISTTDLVRASIEDGVAWLRLNRPSKRNALNEEMTDGLLAALTRVGQMEDVNVIVLTGEGSAFCAGRDIHSLMERMTDREGYVAMPGAAGGLPKALRGVPQIVISMINGPAMGEGLDLALSCDLAIAADDAIMGDLHVVRGVVASTGTWNLPRLVGAKRAAEMTLLGTQVTGVEAERIGLVNRSAPAETLLDATRAYAAEVAALPSTAARFTKRALIHGQTNNLDTTLEFVAFARSVAAKTKDAQERGGQFFAARD